MSFSETIFLFFLALIIFGPKKLPEIARQVGKYLNEFRRASNEFKAQIEQEIAHLENENKQTILAPSPTPAGAMGRSSETTASEPQVTATESGATPAAPALSPVSETNSSGPQLATEAVAADHVTASSSQESHA